VLRPPLVTLETEVLRGASEALVERLLGRLGRIYGCYQKWAFSMLGLDWINVSLDWGKLRPCVCTLLIDWVL